MEKHVDLTEDAIPDEDLEGRLAHIEVMLEDLEHRKPFEGQPENVYQDRRNRLLSEQKELVERLRQFEQSQKENGTTLR